MNQPSTPSDREILPKLDDEAFAHAYTAFTTNPIFPAFIAYVNEQIAVCETVIDNPPSPSDQAGFFALREQAIGSRFALKRTIKDFLLEDLKPQPKQDNV